MIATPQHRTRGRRSVTDEVPEPGPLERPLRFEKLRELLLRERRIRDVLRRSEVGVEPRNSIADVVAREKLRRTVSVLGKKSLAVHSGVYFEMHVRLPGGPQVGLDALEGRERERDARVRSRHEMLGKRAPQNEYGFRDPLFPEAEPLEDRIHAEAVDAQAIEHLGEDVQAVAIGVRLHDRHKPRLPREKAPHRLHVVPRRFAVELDPGPEAFALVRIAPRHARL